MDYGNQNLTQEDQTRCHCSVPREGGAYSPAEKRSDSGCILEVNQ